jgi:selenocysteine lyase/cysteine desulfurase
MAHAAVTAIPQPAVDVMNNFNIATSTGELDYSEVLLKQMDGVRESGARLLECGADEVALLGPTSLGLSLVANGIDWQAGDEIVTYLDDYPANVYPWKKLEKKGVKIIFLRPERVGEITPELVSAAITPKTKMLALASNNFLSGYRLDIEAASELASEQDILFCLDAIQTVGAFPTDAKLVDFLSADSHKWMLGPMTAGLVYVKQSHFETLEPTLIGAWNVKCPNFIANDRIEFEPGGRRYEPGVLNSQGLVGMKASMDMLTGIGINRVAERLLNLKAHLIEGLDIMGFHPIGPRTGVNASGITSFTDLEEPQRIPALFQVLGENRVVASFRYSRDGIPYIRLSPHFYNTHAEIDQLFSLMNKAGT